jgi:hypothetical protein
MKRNFKRVLISLSPVFVFTHASCCAQDHPIDDQPYPGVYALKLRFEAESKRHKEERKSYKAWQQRVHGLIQEKKDSIEDLAHEFGLPKADRTIDPSPEFLEQIGLEIRNLTDKIINEKFPHLPKLEEEILSFRQQKDQFIEGYQAVGYDGENHYKNQLGILESQKKFISQKLAKELSRRKIIQHLVDVLKEQKQEEMLPLLVPAFEILGF